VDQRYGFSPMVLSDEELKVFRKIEGLVLEETNQIFSVAPGVDLTDPAQLRGIDQATRSQLWEHFLKEKEKVVSTLETRHGGGFDEGEVAALSGFGEAFEGKFILLRQLKEHAVFLQLKVAQDGADPPAFGVTGQDESFKVRIGREDARLPRQVETVLIPFLGKIVTNGLLTHDRLPRGSSGIFNEAYRDSCKAQGGLITKVKTASPRPRRLSLSKRVMSKREKGADAPLPVRAVDEKPGGLVVQAAFPWYEAFESSGS
jgi:hypothetical protein